MQYATELGLGLSSFVSVGNKADISSNDLLAYWSLDERTDVILLYLESFGNPRRFARLAREVGRRKPIVAVKSGRSVAGQRAAASHTGALLAASDATVDALFRQAGVIRTDTLEEMFDVATILANQPPPRGNRVAIVTNGGGLGILCADACEANGLHVAQLSEDTTASLRSFLSDEASVANPVDMIASATAEDYRRAIEVVAGDPNVDAMIVIYIPPQATKAAEIGQAIAEGIDAVGGRIPVATTWMSTKGLPAELQKTRITVSRRSRSRNRPPSRWRARPSTAGGAIGRQGRSRPSTTRGTTRPLASSPTRSAVATRDGSRPTRSTASSGATG